MRMTGKIFISYRSEDDPGYAQALYMRLEDEFGEDNVFMDVEGHILPGDDFAEVIESQVAQCDVLIAIIGPKWITILNEKIGDPEDFVQLEIGTALNQDKRVIPCLVGQASMPRAESLPETIRALTRRNAVGLRRERFKADCQGLISAIRHALRKAEAERKAKSEAERKAAEEERRKKEIEEAERVAAAEQRAREQAVGGLSREQISKAEELANWEFVKDRNEIFELRDHIARFAGGVTARYALERLDELVWWSLNSNPSKLEIQDYLDEFPRGKHADEAREKIKAIERRENAYAAREKVLKEETTEYASHFYRDIIQFAIFIGIVIIPVFASFEHIASSFRVFVSQFIVIDLNSGNCLISKNASRFVIICIFLLFSIFVFLARQFVRSRQIAKSLKYLRDNNSRDWSDHN